MTKFPTVVKAFLLAVTFLVTGFRNYGQYMSGKSHFISPIEDTNLVIFTLSHKLQGTKKTFLKAILLKDTLVKKMATFACLKKYLSEKAKTLHANIIESDKELEECFYYPKDFSVVFYYSADLGKFEEELEWDENRKLTWDDFRGSKPDSVQPFAALTYCGFGFKGFFSESRNKNVFEVSNYFSTSKSWFNNVSYGAEKILRHEQGHFDLCEVYTRLLRKKLNERMIPLESLENMSNAIFTETYDAFKARQVAYDDQTNHGLDSVYQSFWNKTIEKELNSLMNFKKIKCY